ncbi:MAG: beta-N-acetylhexosaminidase [Bacteroides nordii]
MKRLYKIYLIIFMSLLTGAPASANEVTAILPYPNHICWKKGTFDIGKQLYIYSNDLFSSEIKRIISVLKKESDLLCKFTNKEKANLKIDIKEDLPREGYSILINAQGIHIEAATTTGVFYAIQTLRQLIKKDGKNLQCPYVEITDSPAFGWRGFLLDEARNFQGKNEVKKLLDEMALLKMNVFHWHLTDDQGWRIEIKKYPLLTEIGGRRDSTQLNWYESTVYDGKPVSGYYSQKDIREIIAYAADRHIKIIPEIEFPGHASAAIAAYPWLSCSKKQISVPCGYGVLTTAFNVVNPQVQEFIHNVLDEVIELFPSDIIHIGGDEVKYDEWLDSEEVLLFMKKEQITSPAELQVWFTNHLSAYLGSKGKKLMGWNDITGDKLHAFQTGNEVKSQLNPENTIVQFWTGNQSLLKKALERGLKVVNNSCEYTYLNYNYDKIVPGLEYAHTPIPLEKAYRFDPVPESVSAWKEQILGLSCAMWGEWTNRPDIMYKMVYPQIATYAETGWTQKENKNFDRFLKSLEPFRERWKSAGYIK